MANDKSKPVFARAYSMQGSKQSAHQQGLSLLEYAAVHLTHGALAAGLNADEAVDAGLAAAELLVQRLS